MPRLNGGKPFKQGTRLVPPKRKAKNRRWDLRSTPPLQREWSLGMRSPVSPLAPRSSGHRADIAVAPCRDRGRSNHNPTVFLHGQVGVAFQREIVEAAHGEAVGSEAGHHRRVVGTPFRRRHPHKVPLLPIPGSFPPFLVSF